MEKVCRTFFNKLLNLILFSQFCFRLPPEFENPTHMNWKLQLPGNDFSAYEFTSTSGAQLSCKYNRAAGSLRLRLGDHHAVFFVDELQLANRKIIVNNAYGSEIALLTKNLWKENSGTVSFDANSSKIHYKIDSHNYLVEITRDNNVNHCDLNNIPHPGKEQHFIPVILAMAWVESLVTKEQVKLSA